MFKFPSFLTIVFSLMVGLQLQAQTINSKELYPVLENRRWGYINGKGQVVIKPQFYGAGVFSEGLAPVRKNGFYGFINNEGKYIINFRYDFAEQFSEGFARVWKNSQCYFIDKSGGIVIRENGFNIRSKFSEGYALVSIKENNNIRRSVINKQGEVINKKRLLKQLLRRLYPNENKKMKFTNGLNFICEDSLCGYQDERKVFVWRYKETDERLDTLNIDFMMSGYFFAFNSPEGICNGCARSVNYLKKIEETSCFQPNRIGLEVNDSVVATFAHNYLGRKVFLYNTTKDTIHFTAQDSRINLKTQALNKDGKWQDIEFLMDSWCGNSYHTLDLAPQKYWEFKMPIYNGEFKTLLRLVLSTSYGDNSKIFYSNVFEGYVNPGQFWRKKSYTPTNFMDPYLN
ncbi:WG repeat-containing protein [Flexithrix dorotheae]|uniref:WG repeat-containing protein n=1 Tax=Flexithrix dorotheae TaxID=70993 RepID=UPI00035FE154|nr:WG repeat-containing protein [Flexithrix dorotheae]